MDPHTHWHTFTTFPKRVNQSEGRERISLSVSCQQVFLLHNVLPQWILIAEFQAPDWLHAVKIVILSCVTRFNFGAHSCRSVCAVVHFSSSCETSEKLRVASATQLFISSCSIHSVTTISDWRLVFNWNDFSLRTNNKAKPHKCRSSSCAMQPRTPSLRMLCYFSEVGTCWL